MLQGKVPTVIFTMQPLGSLEVFTMQTTEEIYAGAPFRGYFWRDAGSPQGYGPFATVFACIEHYKMVIKACNQGKDIPKLDADIIRVDFRSRKRVNI
jgi:hypothetical protein